MCLSLSLYRPGAGAAVQWCPFYWASPTLIGLGRTHCGGAGSEGWGCSIHVYVACTVVQELVRYCECAPWGIITRSHTVAPDTSIMALMDTELQPTTWCKGVGRQVGGQGTWSHPVSLCNNITVQLFYLRICACYCGIQNFNWFAYTMFACLFFVCA